jgi:hypothetical protein
MMMASREVAYLDMMGKRVVPRRSAEYRVLDQENEYGLLETSCQLYESSMGLESEQRVRLGRTDASGAAFRALV